MGKAKPKFWGNPRINSNLLSRKLRTLKQQIFFLQRASILPKSHKCTKCGHTITEINEKLRKWKCPKCSVGVSMYTGTFMHGSNISARKMLLLG